MERALHLALLADHRTSPNPMVGAVVLDAAGVVCGEGWHERAGEPHAEVRALGEAGGRARGGTLYVTLEPCAHRGRTPPCVEAIVAAGVARVVVAMEDPDPRVAGGGLAALRAAGVEVALGVLQEPALRANRFYVHHRLTGRPWITVKFGASLDGRIRTRTGDSRWITGPAAREHAMRERHRHDAILVGVTTVLTDDPALTARLPGARQPLRVVLDTRLRTPASARVAAAGTLVATCAEPGGPLAATGAEILRLPAGTGGRVSLEALLEELGRRGVLSVLAEGGSTVHGALFDGGLVDGVIAYLAPLVIGGEGAGPAVGGLGAARLGDATRLRNLEVERAGDDLVVTADVERRQ